MTDRRYSEEEVAKIFERAAEAQQSGRRQLASGDGMTLAELQEIGREVGIPAELVAQAASRLDQVPASPAPRILGIPVGVGQTVEIGRKLSDAEWEQLVVDLRETFQARGHIRYDGPFRQWTNGNLQALLEPTPTGHRLSLRTVQGRAQVLVRGGAFTTAIGVVVTVVAAMAGNLDAGALAGPAFLGMVGLGMMGSGLLTVPAWARLRRRQIEGVITRLLARGETERLGPGVPGDES